MSWIYIAGRGHSGTTFLDIVLGNSAEIESFGEVISGIDKVDAKCACGRPISKCQFWRKVRADFSKQHGDWQKSVALLKQHTHIRYWHQLFLTNHYWKNNVRLTAIDKALRNALEAEAATKWILDSQRGLTSY